MSGTPKATWTLVQNAHPGDTQTFFETCIEEFILRHMTQDAAVDTKEWLMTIKKPRD